jgi:hypothetical protein
MMKNKRLFLFLVFFFLLAACSPDRNPEPLQTATPSTPLAGLAQVTALDIRRFETFPVQIQVSVEGILPDSCTTIERIDQARRDGNFQITLNTVRATGVACLDAEVPFTETIDLDVLGLTAGIYTIQVNGIGGTFTLQKDNLPDESNAVIGGRVWHDICAIGGGEGGEPAVPSEGCIPRSDGSYLADGVLQQGEPGLGGVIVTLGEGGCPSAGLGTTITDGEGFFLFSGLRAGTYCASVDIQNQDNASLLVPGEWTHITDGSQGMASVVLKPAENRSDLHFGWDYQFLPAAESTDPDCTDVASFSADITVPDDTVFLPGETFTKTWQLLNNGTCIWDSSYSLVFVSGDQMGGPEIQRLAQTVAPGETVDISVILVAPTGPGTYRGEWLLRNSNGLLFGIGEETNAPFWIQIVVE